MSKISIIIPCYNEELSIPLFYKEIDKITKQMKDNSFEIIFVDDGSKDNTLGIIKQLTKNDKRMRYISFSRNFGKEAAMYAGLKNATGDYVTLMDSDLQDPPSLLPEMYKIIINEGYDQVGAKRISRTGEPKIRSFFAKRFYKIINKLNDKIEIVDGARDFRLMKRIVVDAILSLEENERFTKGIFSYVGFKTKWLEYENINRAVGKTKWSFKSLFGYAVDGILSFTTKPLKLPILFGLLSIIGSIVMFVFLIINNFNISDLFVIIDIILFMFGLFFNFVGIIGLYLAKDYIENKNRPIYIIKEAN